MVSTSKSFGRGRPYDRLKPSRSNDWSVGSGGSSILRAAHAKRSPSPSRTAAAVSKYSPQRNQNKGNNIASVRSSILSKGSTPQERFQNMQKTNGRLAGASYGSKSADNLTQMDSLDSFDAEMMNTDLYKTFEAVFNNILKNNPGILPGAPSVIKPIKTALYKAQKNKANKEEEIRKQLDKINGEVSSLEQQVSQQKEEMARRKSECSKELEAIEATKKIMTEKMDEVKADKDEMARHLDFLKKAHSDIEKALQSEVKAVEKDRDILKRASNERKKIQKVKEENESLKDEVDRESDKANKENQTLKQRKEELKELAEKNKSLKKENESLKKELEMEQQGLTEMNKSIKTKKVDLDESKKAVQDQMKELEESKREAQDRMKELEESKREAQDRMKELESELASVKKQTGFLSTCDGGNQTVGTDVYDLEPDKQVHSAFQITSVREIPLEFTEKDEVNVRARSKSRSKEQSRARSKSRSKAQRRKTKKKEEEQIMINEIDNLRTELEAVRLRNNIALHEQESRDAEDALIDRMEIMRAEIRLNDRNSFSTPSNYNSHHDLDNEERYYSFIRQEREPASPRYSHVSPGSRRYNLEDEDDRPSSHRRSSNREPTSPRFSHASPGSRRFKLEDEDDRPSSNRRSYSSRSTSTGRGRRSSIPYSDGATRTTPEWRRSKF